MPELPELAALARGLTELAGGRMLASAEIAAVGALKTVQPTLADCEGRTLLEVQRRGKYLCWQLDGPRWIVLHLARAGWLRWRADAPSGTAGARRGPLVLRLVLADADGSLVGRCDMTEAGTRKSGAVWVVDDPAEVPGIARLGPDPLADGFTAEVLDAILRRAGRSQLKGVLRDQSVVAGIGNAYSDEILHAARLSPFRAADSLSEQERAGLYAHLRGVLGDAVQRAAQAPMAELKDGKRAGMAVHGRTGQPCPVCGDTVREVSFADSSLQYCPTCQTGGKPLADRRMSRLLK